MCAHAQTHVHAAHEVHDAHVATRAGAGRCLQDLVAVPDGLSDEAAAQALVNPVAVMGLFDELSPPPGAWAEGGGVACVGGASGCRAVCRRHGLMQMLLTMCMTAYELWSNAILGTFKACEGRGARGTRPERAEHAEQPDPVPVPACASPDYPALPAPPCMCLRSPPGPCTQHEPLMPWPA